MKERPDPVGAEQRRRRRWRWIFAAAAAVVLVVLVLNVVFYELDPARPWGLAYGTSAAVLLLALLFYGSRRRSPRVATRWRLGSARGWLSFHLWGGALFMFLMLLHSGFAWPQGGITRALWLLSAWTLASGLLGLALQRWIPRALASGLRLEVLYERIPELVTELRSQAEVLVASCGRPVQGLYQRSLGPALEAPRRRLLYFVDITGGRRSELRELNYLRRFLDSEESEKVERLGRLYETKLELDAHYTLQGALRWWLGLHLPAAVLLVVLLILHLVAVIYY